MKLPVEGQAVKIPQGYQNQRVFWWQGLGATTVFAQGSARAVCEWVGPGVRLCGQNPISVAHWGCQLGPITEWIIIVFPSWCED